MQGVHPTYLAFPDLKRIVVDAAGNARVLELGAGAALPSLCAALLGARTVLVTDYPDARMLENTAHNLDVNLPGPLRRRVRACGYDWSRPASRLLDELRALEAAPLAAAPKNLMPFAAAPDSMWPTEMLWNIGGKAK